MNEQEILNSLATLEQTLQGIDSARKQVQNVVSAYDAVKNQFSVLNNDISAISSDLKSIFDTIKENNDTVSSSLNSRISDTFTAIDSKIKLLEKTSIKMNEDFGLACNASTVKFSSAVDASIAKLNEGIVTSVSHFKEKANNEIAKVSTLIASLEGTSTGISNEFKKEFETFSANNKSAQSEIVTYTKTEIQKQLSGLEQLKKDLETILKNYNQLYSQIKQDNDLAFNEIKSILSKTQNSISDITTLVTDSDKSNTEFFKNINQKIEGLSTQLSEQKNANDATAKLFKNKFEMVSKQQKKAQTITIVSMVLLAISLLINMLMLIR